jgi:hypothetical protein
MHGLRAAVGLAVTFAFAASSLPQPAGGQEGQFTRQLKKDRAGVLSAFEGNWGDSLTSCEAWFKKSFQTTAAASGHIMAIQGDKIHWSRGLCRVESLRGSGNVMLGRAACSFKDKHAIGEFSIEPVGASQFILRNLLSGYFGPNVAAMWYKCDCDFAEADASRLECVKSRTRDFDFERYKARDFDAYLAERRKLSTAARKGSGLDIFKDWEAVRLDGTLFLPPVKWSNSMIFMLNRMTGAEFPPINYGLLIETKAKRLVMLHVQDSIANSILREISERESKGEASPVGRKIRVWVVYAYNAAGFDGLIVNFAQTEE